MIRVKLFALLLLPLLCFSNVRATTEQVPLLAQENPQKFGHDDVQEAIDTFQHFYDEVIEAIENRPESGSSVAEWVLWAGGSIIAVLVGIILYIVNVVQRINKRTGGG